MEQLKTFLEKTKRKAAGQQPAARPAAHRLVDVLGRRALRLAEEQRLGVDHLGHARPVGVVTARLRLLAAEEDRHRRQRVVLGRLHVAVVVGGAVEGDGVVDELDRLVVWPELHRHNLVLGLNLQL